MAMKSIIYVLLIVATNSYMHAQSVAGLNTPFDIKHANDIAEIIQWQTIFIDTISKTSKEVFTLNKKGIVKSHHIFEKNDSLTHISVSYFDGTDSRVIRSETYETPAWSDSAINTITEYYYNKKGLIDKSIIKDNKGFELWIVHYKYDERGNVVVSKYDKIPPLISTITPSYDRDSVSYDYKNNYFESFTLDKSGGVIISTSSSLGLNIRSKDDIYDKYNNPIKKGGSEFSYLYDRKGNWVKQAKYNFKNGKRIKTYEIERKISYRE